MTDGPTTTPGHHDRSEAHLRRRLLVAAAIATFGVIVVALPGPQEAAASADPQPIAAGGSHTCTVLADGSVACWGQNYFGQIGDGTTAFRAAPTPVSGITTARSISSRFDHTCVVLADRTPRCWGYNFQGQLGNNTQFNTAQTTPVTPTGVTDVASIAAGGDFTCATLDSGSVSCWGANVEGQLGDATNAPSLTATTVSGLTDAEVVTAGSAFACAIRTGRTAVCWGENGDGQLGNGLTDSSNVPVSVPLTGMRGISAANRHACAAIDPGQVWCWGSNSGAALGIGTTSGNELSPVQVSDISSAVDVVATDAGGCALLDDEGAAC